MEFNGSQFVAATGVKICQQGRNTKAHSLCTDSRVCKSGQLFFALRGPNFDGHQFVEDVIEKGAWGVVINKMFEVRSAKFDVSNKNCWVFESQDPLTSLGDIASWWRRQFNIPLVAITGSNGKTTTKEMTSSILSTRSHVLKTEGNFNNLIGLPLTLDRLDATHQAAVLEMGMSEFGEIKRLTEISNPTLGCITNAAAAHLEKLHTVEAVANAKGELFEAMSSQSIAVYNAEDSNVCAHAERFKGEKISFGMTSDCDVFFEHMESTDVDAMSLTLSIRGQSMRTELKTSGIHNVMNAMAACGIALGVGYDVQSMQEGLKNFIPLKMRLEQVQLANGVRLVNDAYNANPVSMEAAFRTVSRAKRSGRLIAILGDMKELGTNAENLHEAVGQKVAQFGFSPLFLIGEFASAIARGASTEGMNKKNIIIAADTKELVAKVEREMRSGDIVLVKASRAMRLEKVVESLKETFGI